MAWNAHATYETTLVGSGEVSFLVPFSANGVVVGGAESFTGATYNEFNFAFFFEGGTYRVIEGGTFVTSPSAYADMDTFRIRRFGGEVQYYRNNTLVYTSFAYTDAHLTVGAMFYTPGDYIEDLAVALYSSGRVDLPFSVLGGVGARFSYGRVDIPFAVEGGVGSGSSVFIDHFIYGGEGGYSYGRVDIPFTVSGSASGVTGFSHGGVWVFHTMDAGGEQYPPVMGRVDITFAAWGSEEAYATGGVDINHWLFARGSLKLENYLLGVIPSVVVGENIASTDTGFTANLSDGFTSSDTALSIYVPIIRDIVALSLAMKAESHTEETLALLTQAQEQFKANFPINLVALVAAADTADARSVLILAEQLLLTDAVTSHAHALAFATLALSVGDLLGHGTAEELLDSISASSEVRVRLSALAREVMEVLDVPVGHFRIVVSDTLSGVVSDEATALAAYHALIDESVGAVLLFNLGGEAYTGYVTLTEGENPTSTYLNYPFNSFTGFGGSYYAASDEGLYKLEGADDAGEAISASVKTLMLDFADSRMKRVQTAYIGYTSTGGMILKVLAVTNGQLREHWFKATDRTADAPREQVVNLGRGLRSRYWQFELSNVDGADFEIDKLEFYPIILSRRV